MVEVTGVFAPAIGTGNFLLAAVGEADDRSVGISIEVDLVRVGHFTIPKLISGSSIRDRILKTSLK